MKPEVSIIVPVYNVDKHLKSCIESLLNQTFSNYEIIIVDDGSTDLSPEICDEYANKYKRIKSFHIKNSGVSYARNFGIKKSIGKYIMFCDSDDYVEKDWCEKLYNTLNTNCNSFVMCGFNIYNRRNGKFEIKKMHLDTESTIITNKRDYFSNYKIKLLATVWNKIYEKRIIVSNNIRFYDNLSLGEDLIFNLDYLKKSNDKIIIIKQHLYNYFLRDADSLDHKYYDNLHEIYKYLNKRIYEDAVLYKADNESFNKWYWKKYYWDFDRVITTNTFHEKNKKNILYKIIYNVKVTKSKEFKKCISNLTEEDIDKDLLKVLRTFNYIKIFMYLENLSCKDILKKIHMRMCKNL